MDYKPTSRRLSEISHLFLSDVRKKQTDGATPPTRTPPSQTPGGFRGDLSVDLTPEEFANMMRPATDTAIFKPARIVLAHHLGEAMADRVRDLAATLAGQRSVGIVYADLAGVRVCCVDSNSEETVEECAVEPLDAQRFREVLVELDQDVAEWLIVLPDPRTSEAAGLLGHAANWTLLSGADHESVVAAYRTLKGVVGDAKPALSLSIFGAETPEDVEKTARKLAGVCEQFLKVGIATGPAIIDAPDAREACLLDALAEGNVHWQVLTALVDSAAAPGENTTPAPVVTATIAATPTPHIVTPAAPVARAIAAMPPVMRMTPQAPAADDAETILDLIDADATPAGILRSFIHGAGEFVESPVKPPMLADAVVAVGRDRRLTLIAVAKPGLTELRSVAAGLRWMLENRSLIVMAVPQLAIDSSIEPRLHLIVDQADADADAMQPLLAAGSVTVAAYRKVRWAGRAGLLMQAA
ncbi:MAG: hypothetical protein JWM57_2938 [Phycisphaerales bacterium]|nr:hypothetical protein [Phycisphaerales bacterium]